MKQLGISVYPEHSDKKEMEDYIVLASKYGFTRIFTCLLSAEETREEIIKNFGDFCRFAHRYGMKVSVDTNPTVFEKLGATPSDISVFHDMDVDIIRLDGWFSENDNILLTYNPYGIKIEFASTADLPMDLMIRGGANVDNMCMCANFYPQPHTGIGLDRLVELSERYKHLGITNAAFVSSNNEHTFGPWKVFAGLPTLEMHRHLPIDLQARHLFAMGYFKDVLIGNAYATKEELEALASSFYDYVKMKIELVEDCSEIEQDILFNCNHNNRQDCNDIVIRSSYPRVKYKGQAIKPRSVSKKMFERGDVIIVNDNLEHYRSELMVVLKPIEVSEEYNLVGHISSDEQILLPYIKGNHPFGFLK